MTSFAGQLSFPGGRIEPTDPSPLHAALRETEEEIGLARNLLEVLGYFADLTTHLGTLVLCYGARLEPAVVPTEPASRQEVEEILQVPMASLLSLETQPEVDNASTYVATRYESRTVTMDHAPSRTLHYWTLSNGREHKPTVLWGLTAEMVYRILRDAYGWVPPSPARIVRRPEDLQP